MGALGFDVHFERGLSIHLDSLDIPFKTFPMGGVPGKISDILYTSLACMLTEKLCCQRLVETGLAGRSIGKARLLYGMFLVIVLQPIYCVSSNSRLNRKLNMS